jgi:hypothetical protein
MPMSDAAYQRYLSSQNDHDSASTIEVLVESVRVLQQHALIRDQQLAALRADVARLLASRTEEGE